MVGKFLKILWMLFFYWLIFSVIRLQYLLFHFLVHLVAVKQISSKCSYAVTGKLKKMPKRWDSAPQPPLASGGWRLRPYTPALLFPGYNSRRKMFYFCSFRTFASILFFKLCSYCWWNWSYCCWRLVGRVFATGRRVHYSYATRGRQGFGKISKFLALFWQFRKNC